MNQTVFPNTAESWFMRKGLVEKEIKLTRLLDDTTSLFDQTSFNNSTPEVRNACQLN